MQKVRSYIPLLHRRSFIMFGLQIVGFGALASRLYYLQHLNSNKYKTLSDRNRFKVNIIPSNRGAITDETGAEISNAKQVFRVQILKHDMKSFLSSLENLKQYIKITPEQEEKIIKKAKRTRKYTYILIKEHISWKDMSRIQVNKTKLYGVNVSMGETRSYPYKNLFAHVVGYVGKISHRDVKDNKDDPLLFVPGFEIGKSGIEKSYENHLRGSVGAEQVEVNVNGQIVNTINDIQPTKGDDLQLSINLELQKFIAEKLSAHNSASMVVLDVNTGDVKGMYSHPSFDPNLFVGGISYKDWNRIRNNKYSQLLNKAIAGQYAPGSTFKMAVGLAALYYNIDTKKKVFCNGGVEISNHKYHCWKKTGHGRVDMVKSLRESCDIWYYQKSLEIGIDNIAKVAKKLGLGMQYDFDITPQLPGLVPTKEWKKNKQNKSWYIGDTVISSIGQGVVLATPLQLAVMTARIATGREVVPRMTKVDGDGELRTVKFNKMKINTEHLDIIRQGMYEVVNHERGTAKRSRTTGWKMAGKTGTSQVRRISQSERESEDGVIKNQNLKWEYRDHALFVGYAPADNPKYAIACVVEHGGSGSAAAAPLVRDVMNKIYTMEKKT
ncbi:MAG: penicillin-binding protein 2 [Alphaproteobacteria bacterium]